MTTAQQPGRSGPLPVKAIAEAVLERMNRLGLTWRLRPATITAVTPDGGIRGVYDADTQPVRLVSMLGPVAVGARVMVLRTPPAGNHIVGWAGTPAPGTAPDALAWSETNSPAVTAQTVVLSTPILLRARTAYRVEMAGGITGSVAGVLADFRLRRVAGDGQPAQALAEFYRYRTEGAPVVACHGVRHIRRTANTDLQATIELTLETTTGSVLHVGGVARPRYLQITACGEAAKWPHVTVVNG